MKASGMFSILALAASASAIPLPQFTWPGGSSGGTSSSTSNDVTNNVQPCRGTTVIFARGTSEGGNIGSIIGPQLKKALISKLGANGIAFQGVPYPANAAVSYRALIRWRSITLLTTLKGNTSGGGTGPGLMQQLAEQAKRQCPDTKIVLSGYSQGGIVVHNAAKKLSATPLAGGESTQQDFAHL